MRPLDGRTSSKIAAFGFVCAFLVVSIHVPQPFPSGPDLPAWWLCRLTAGTFGRLAVPFFFAAAGFFLARRFGEPGWWRRAVATRARSLLVPFFFWLLAWDALCALLAGAANLRDGLPAASGFPRGAALLAFAGLDPFDYPANIPLWFLRSLFLYAVASRVLLPALERVGPALPAALLVASAALRLADGDAAAVRFLDRFVSLQGLAFFLAGASLAMGRLRLPRPGLPAGLLGAAGWAGLFASQFLAARGVAWNGALHELSLAPALLAAWRLFPAVAWPKGVTSLAFPVYVLHVFAIRVLDVAVYGVSSCGGLVLKYAAVCVATAAAAAVSKTFLPRFHSFAFGGR